jgi:hypothetical protein
VPPAPVVISIDKIFHQPPERSDARFAAAAVQAYRDPRFGGEHTERRWVFKYPWTSDTKVQSMPFPLLGQILSGIFKGLLWLLVIGALGTLLWFAWRHRGRWAREAEEDAPMTPASVQASVHGEQPLPADLAGATRQLWQAQRRREALALLYRGCVEQTERLLQMPPSTDATEADWLRQATTIGDPLRAQRVIAIVRAWQFAAYAGRYPDDAVIETLLSGWPVQAGGAA